MMKKSLFFKKAKILPSQSVTDQYVKNYSGIQLRALHCLSLEHFLSKDKLLVIKGFIITDNWGVIIGDDDVVVCGVALSSEQS